MKIHSPKWRFSHNHQMTTHNGKLKIHSPKWKFNHLYEYFPILQTIFQVDNSPIHHQITHNFKNQVKNTFTQMKIRAQNSPPKWKFNHLYEYFPSSKQFFQIPILPIPHNFKNQVKNTFTQMKIRQIFLHTREEFQGTTPLVQMKIRPSKSSFPPPNENSTKQIHTSFPFKGLNIGSKRPSNPNTFLFLSTLPLLKR